jgi:quinohemoprotein ethanol dehydrogenase
MSWNPNTGLVYIPGQNNNNYYAINTAFEAQAGRSNTGLVGRGGTPEGFVRPPAPPMENPGAFFLAWDPVAQEERWRVITGGFSNGGTMTTAGNLLFAGHGNGNLQAYNATTGELLWERMTAGGVGQPVTYELDGRQYVSVMAGRGGNTPSAVWTFTIDD